MKTEFIATVIATTIAIITVVVGITYYHTQRDASMKSNIESAIVKGIDPIAVKCAYGYGSDPVCVVYASNRK
jgi:hypothetical protein